MKKLKFLSAVLQFAVLATAANGCSEDTPSAPISQDTELQTRVFEEKMPKLITLLVSHNYILTCLSASVMFAIR